jgi:hypothetical protein
VALASVLWRPYGQTNSHLINNRQLGHGENRYEYVTIAQMAGIVRRRIVWLTDRQPQHEGSRFDVGRRCMHNTYDIFFYGAEPLSNIYFLAALKAMAAMARHLGEAVGRRDDRGR